MKEIETKFLVRDFAGVRRRVKKLGGRLDWKGLEESYFFDTNKGSLKKIGASLRLRSWKGHSNTLTLKTKSGRHDKRYKVRNEYQVTVNNLETTGDILENLGFREYLRYKKHREHWVLPAKTAVELDTLPNRRFVEVEAPPAKIKKIAKVLGLDWKQTTTKSYLKILRQDDAVRNRIFAL